MRRKSIQWSRGRGNGNTRELLIQSVITTAWLIFRIRREKEKKNGKSLYCHKTKKYHLKRRNPGTILGEDRRDEVNLKRMQKGGKEMTLHWGGNKRIVVRKLDGETKEKREAKEVEH